jgi:AcrR family transcriptional regulator
MVVTKKSALNGTALRSGGRAESGSRTSEAREKVLTAAYDLFSRHGIRAVGVDTIIAEAGVAKMTFYRHFPCKDDLVLAFLQRRELLWSQMWLEAEVLTRAATPAQRLLAIFEVFDEWFRRDDFEGCSFINVLLETVEPAHPVRHATMTHLARIRHFVQGLAKAAGVAQPDDFAHKWHLLMKGSIVAAGEGDRLAARRAQDVGLLVLQSEGPRFQRELAGVRRLRGRHVQQRRRTTEANSDTQRHSANSRRSF